MSASFDVAVVGAGLSGLAFAHRLVEHKKETGADLKVTVYERGSRVGGALHSEAMDGFLLEWGADSFLTEKPAAIELCRRLGLESEVIETSPGARRSFVARRGRLVRVPDGFYLTAPLRLGPFFRSGLFSPTGKARIFLERCLPARRSGAEESVASFIRRRFGREALERAGQPLLAGIYTGDPETLSMSAALPKFVELERRYGSVTRGLAATRAGAEASGPRYSLFASLRQGMGALARKLFVKLPMASVRMGLGVRGMRLEDGRWRLELASGESARHDALAVALPPAEAAALLESACPAAAGALRKMRSESVAVAHFAFRAEDVGHPLDGAGFVVPRTERSPLLACSFSSRKFESRSPEGTVLLRAFAGGAFGADAYALDDGALLAALRREIGRYLNVSREPLMERLLRHPGAMVQYALGHRSLADAALGAARTLPGLRLVGNAYAGVGIPDCVALAESAADATFAERFPTEASS